MKQNSIKEDYIGPLAIVGGAMILPSLLGGSGGCGGGPIQNLMNSMLKPVTDIASPIANIAGSVMTPFTDVAGSVFTPITSVMGNVGGGINFGGLGGSISGSFDLRCQSSSGIDMSSIIMMLVVIIIIVVVIKMMSSGGGGDGGGGDYQQPQFIMMQPPMQNYDDYENY